VIGTPVEKGGVFEFRFRLHGQRGTCVAFTGAGLGVRTLMSGVPGVEIPSGHLG